MNLLGFGKTLIIANFFFLEDLGIISIVLMMEVLSTFTETGFDAALVQKKENIHSYLNTAWTAGLINGIILFFKITQYVVHAEHSVFPGGKDFGFDRVILNDFTSLTSPEDVNS